MNRLVRAELLKQRTVPAVQVAFAAVPIVAGLVAFAVLGMAGRQGNDPLGPDSLGQALSAPASVVTTLALLLGVIGLAGEYRHKTITTTLLASPRRRSLVLAKVGAHSLTGAAMGLVTVAVTAVIAVPWLVTADVPLGSGGDAARIAGALVLSTALHAALGVSVGALIRNQTAAVGVVLVWLLALEDVVVAVVRSAVIAEWLPGRLASALVGANPGSLSPWLAGAALVAYVGAFVAVGTRFVVSRDVT